MRKSFDINNDGKLINSDLHGSEKKSLNINNEINRDINGSGNYSQK